MAVLSAGERHYSSAEDVETCCFCMPLRLGVFFIALLTFVFSLVYICDHEHWQNASRHFSGGYSARSRVIIALVEMSGVLFGLVGLVGAYYARRGHIATFNLWQFARMGAWLWMFFVDIPLLRRCEDWVNDIDNMVASHGWNNVMYDIAMDGACPHERRLFYVCSGLTFLFFAYMIYAVFRYTDTVDRVPKHLLRIPKDLAPGAFYAHSSGERGALQGQGIADPYGAVNLPSIGMPATGMPAPTAMHPMPGQGFMGTMQGPVGMPVGAPF